MSVFSDRLKLIMEERGITQAQLCTLTGIPKSAMTQYIHASFKPKQYRTDSICRALNVNPAWIMGLTDQRTAYGVVTLELTPEEERLISVCRENPAIRAEVMRIAHADGKPKVFRAAKSKDGKGAPTLGDKTGEWVERICSAPETDDDL